MLRRDEHPVRRVNPSGKVRWIARYTDSDGRRQTAGTFAKEGPCKHPEPEGACCAQHRIWHMYGVEAPSPAGLQTVGGYFDGWLDLHPRPERTAADYAGRVRAVLDVMVDGRKFRDWPIREVKRSHLGRLVDVMLREHGRAASGTRAVVSVLSAMFENAIDDGVIDANPALGIRVRSSDPRVQKAKRSITVASWDEMHAFAQAAGEFEPMVRVLSDCGLRLGEMLGLECRHVRGDVLVVEQSAWHGVVSPGTKQSARREAPIPPVLRSMLAPLAADRIGLLFPALNGRAWHERSFYRVAWYPAQERSGLMLRPHDARHSYVSLMRAAGVDPADLAEWTGHTVAVATSTYTHSIGRTADLARSVVG